MLYDPKWKYTKPKLRGWRRVLWDAADLIDENGWIQHKKRTKNGYCIIGAICEVDASDNSCLLAEAKFCDVVGVLYAEVWNDKRGRTKEEVVAKLREIALRA